jgi:Mrp family chromosome partitioning ATPase
MESIRQAVERARAGSSSPSDAPPRRTDLGGGSAVQIDELELNVGHLEARRIVAYNGADQRSRPYDMLRTQVLQSMGVSGWKVLGVTSPTPGCGKTVTAINLALSIARQPDHSVVLIDLDLQKPQVGASLGITPAYDGALALLEERASLQSVVMPIRAGNQHIVVLPTAATRESSELMGSRTMRTLMQDIKRKYQYHTIIVDLPPILSSDDVIAILPQIDCVLLVAAVGHSKVSEVEECNRHVQSSHLVRVVVNKATEDNSSYYY